MNCPTRGAPPLDLDELERLLVAAINEPHLFNPAKHYAWTCIPVADARLLVALIAECRALRAKVDMLKGVDCHGYIVGEPPNLRLEPACVRFKREAANALDELERKIAWSKSILRATAAERDQLQTMYLASQAQADALRVDAERYRWLRANANNGFDHSEDVQLVVCDRYQQCDAALDAALDAAMGVRAQVGEP